VTYRHLYPPVRSCQHRDCQNMHADRNILTLTDPLTHNATLFTLKHGALPIYTTSLYCCACSRRYYHNYHVHKQSSLRTYYGGVPETVQVTQDFFIESALLELFANNMVFGWFSATNCARIYNAAMSSPQPHVVNNKLAFPADVMNGFFLYSFLLDKSEQSGILVLPHDESSQGDRLKPALAERKSVMEGTGQEC
ncbi:hypothetical protein DFH09DRAFT_951397, partial [Mycena vulgaris]